MASKSELIAAFKKSHPEITEGVCIGNENKVRKLTAKERDAKYAEWADEKLKEEAEKAARDTLLQETETKLAALGITAEGLRLFIECSGRNARKIGGN